MSRMNLILSWLVLLVAFVVAASFSICSVSNRGRPSRRHHLGLQQELQTTDPPICIGKDSIKTSTAQILAPHEKFRTTQNGELSIVTFNMLAPFYNSLQFEKFKQQEEFAREDRQSRVPLSIEMAKGPNADILCLQEVEGGPEFEPKLKELLAQTCVDGREGYDSYLWTPLMPNRSTDVVGLCVAWRSSKYRLVASDCFKRGMICQMAEVDTGATFCIGNVHLPARPSNVLGRLKTMARTINKLASYDPPQRVSPLDGLMLVVGDFNSDHTSVTARLLTTGRSPYGNLKDRNYKANVSKASAAQMRHEYRFRDVYEGVREDYAPVTVSLHGRGPGCMDQLFYAQCHMCPKRRGVSSKPSLASNMRNRSSKRKSRRDKAARMRLREVVKADFSTPVKVDTVLGTISGPDDTERLEIINSGLPNVEQGFPSDHIPIGALFVADPNYKKDQIESDASMSFEKIESTAESGKMGGISSQVRRRRHASVQSVSVRRRHNAVLRCVADWLMVRGATHIARDQPLYKNPLLQGLPNLKKKSRAPDLVCVVGDHSLVIVEISVSAKPEKVRTQKLNKYSDLATLLPEAPVVQEAGWNIMGPFVIVLDELGRIPDDTRHDLFALAALTTNTNDEAKADAQRFCNQLQAMFIEVQETRRV